MYDSEITHNGHTIGHRATNSFIFKKGWYVDNWFRFGTLKKAKQAIDSGEIERAWEAFTGAVFNAMSKEKGSPVRWEDSPTRKPLPATL